ncbi:MAG: hypothetical protein RLZZ301_466 [Bacteroidota bacterium]
MLKRFLFYFLGLIGLAACGLEDARPDPHPSLTVASNFIDSTQQLRFKHWAKQTGIRLHFVQLQASQVQQQLHERPWAPGFDLICVNSMLEVKKLEKSSFQPVGTYWTRANHVRSFLNKQWLEIGRIPIVASYCLDSLNKPAAYTDLSKTFLWGPADESAQEIVRAHFAYIWRKNEKNYNQWYRGFRDYRTAFIGLGIQNTQLLLSRYDTYLKAIYRKDKHRKIKMLSQFGKGPFCDRLAVAIVKQSAHYAEAKRFIKLLLKKRSDAKFCKLLGIHPVYSKPPSQKTRRTYTYTYLHPDLLLKALEK